METVTFLIRFKEKELSLMQYWIPERAKRSLRTKIGS